MARCGRGTHGGVTQRIRDCAKVPTQAAIMRVVCWTPADLGKGRASLLCAQILPQMKKQNSPKGIALAKVAVGVGPAGVTELDQRAAVAERRDFKTGARAHRMPRACDALPLDRPRVRLDDLPFKGRIVLGVRGEKFILPVRLLSS